MWARNPPHGQLRIVGERGTHANHDRIDQRPEPVQMIETRRPIDVSGVAGFGGNAPIKRLADLADHDQIISFPDHEWPE
jgi:hypothetical protein